METRSGDAYKPRSLGSSVRRRRGAEVICEGVNNEIQ